MINRFLTLISLFFVFSYAAAVDFISNGVYYNIISPNEVEITGGKEEVYVGKVIIPETAEYNGVTYKVTAVGDYAFSGCFLMDTCILPQTVKVIKPWGFAKCGKMLSVTLPDSLVEIGEAGFAGCKSLKTIELPEKLEKIGKQAFAECGITGLILPNSVKEIGQMAFNGCLNLTYFTTFMENTAFATPDGALYTKDCKTLLAYPNAKSADYSVFPIAEVIGDYAFAGCNNLRSVTLGDNVRSIGTYAFESCSNLATVSIGKSLVELDSLAFIDNKSLKSFSVSQENMAFSQVNGVLFSKDGTVLVKYPNAYGTDYYMSESVKEIGDYAFATAEALTGIGVGPNVKKIGVGAFELCNNLAYVSLPYTNLETISDRAFSGCLKIVGITFPESLKTIGHNAFKDCYGLQNVSIPDNIVSIGEHCFGGCTNLVDVELGRGLMNIGNYAFYGCSSLANLSCMKREPLEIPANVFEYVDKAKCHLIVLPASVSKYREAPVWCEFKNIHDAGVESVVCGVTVSVSGLNIEVFGFDGEINIYGTDGACVYSGMRKNIVVPGPGVYIIQADKAYKVLVK